VSTLPERIVFLKKIHLFSGLSDEDLTELAQTLVDEPFKTGDVIIKQDTRGDTFYAIYSGTVKVVRQQNKREQTLAQLVPQDFFGEEELFTKKTRSASIIATSDGSVLALHHSKLHEFHAPAVAAVAVQMGAGRRGGIFCSAQASHPAMAGFDRPGTGLPGFRDNVPMGYYCWLTFRDLDWHSRHASRQLMGGLADH
jgi:CRP-like cAMP-binding protein